MDLPTLLGSASSTVFIGTAAIGAVRHFVKREVQSELQPSNGDSFRNHVDRKFADIEDHLGDQDTRMDHLSTRLSNHIDDEHDPTHSRWPH